MNRFSEKCADLGTENVPFIYPILGKTEIFLRKGLCLFLMFIESYLYAKKSEKKWIANPEKKAIQTDGRREGQGWIHKTFKYSQGSNKY